MTFDSKLKPHPTIPKADKPVLVCILDGWGENVNKDEYNAIHIADTPTTDRLKEVAYRWRTVQAHGTAVGLPSDAGTVTRPAFMATQPWYKQMVSYSVE